MQTVSTLPPSRDRVSVVIPAFNEGEEIGRTLTRVVAELDATSARFTYEIVVVDDGSTDETGATVAAFASSYPALNVCTHPANRGLVEALRTGARVATGATIVFLDADLSYAPAIVERLVATLIECDAAMVIASPYMVGGRVGNVPTDRLLASRGANWLLARCVGGRIKTFTGMVRAYRASTLHEILERKTRGEFNAWLVAELLRRDARIVEIPAALIWPETRTQAPSRMTVAKLWARIVLVLVTAQTLLTARLARRVKRL